jgi:hypothetical protein
MDLTRIKSEGMRNQEGGEYIDITLKLHIHAFLSIGEQETLLKIIESKEDEIMNELFEAIR